MEFQFNGSNISIEHIKPGGNLLISVPSYFPEKICWLLSKDYQNMPGGHVRIFRKSVLQEKVEEKGYNLERTEKYHALHSPYWWLRCLFWSSQESNFLVKVYKKILEIQILRNPMILIRKSLVLYRKIPLA